MILFRLVFSQKPKTRIKFLVIDGLVKKNISVFCLRWIALYFKSMPNPAEFYKRIFLNVIAVCIIVPWCDLFFIPNKIDFASFAACYSQRWLIHANLIRQMYLQKPFIQYKCYKKYRVILIIDDMNYCTMENGNSNANKYALKIEPRKTD